MAFSPLQILFLWLRSVVAVVVIGAGVYCWKEWYDRSHVRTDTGVREERGADPNAAYRFDSDVGWNVPTALLAGGVVTAAWSLGGGLLLARLRRRKGDPAEARHLTHDRHGDGRNVHREDETYIYTEAEGPVDAPVLLLTHGWGGTGAEWNAIRPHLGERYRVVRWDLPGLGRSEAPRDRGFSLDRMARDLRLVLDNAVPSGRPVVLVGHSIGAMIQLTFARLFPEVVRERVAGMVFAHGTYTNPLRTHERAGLYSKLQKPVIEPLLYAAIPLSPLLHVLNWATYLNGSAHRSTERSGFSGNETREQLDFATWFGMKAPIAAVARGTLGMLHWDASEMPARLDVLPLFWAGEKDPTTCPEASLRMSSQAPRGDLHTQGDAKHLGPIEFHADFGRRLLRFADACLSHRAAAPSAPHRMLVTPPPPPVAERPSSSARAPGAGAERLEAAKTEPDRAHEPAPARAVHTPDDRNPNA